MAYVYVLKLDISGLRGRPQIAVSREQLLLLQRQGFRVKAMARILGCSTSYLYRKLRSLGIAMRDRFTPIDDNDLEQHIRRLHDHYPRSGCEVGSPLGNNKPFNVWFGVMSII